MGCKKPYFFAAIITIYRALKIKRVPEQDRDKRAACLVKNNYRKKL